MTHKRHSSGGKKVEGKSTVPNPKSKVNSRGPGRPQAFKTEYIEKAAKLYRLGAIDEEVAKSLGVALSTLYKWKSEFTEFSEAVRLAREVATDKVEAALFKRATGMLVPAIHFSSFQGIVEQTQYQEYYPPDTAAQSFWLKANRPDKYRDVTKMEHSGRIAAGSTQVEEMSVEEIEAELARRGAKVVTK